MNRSITTGVIATLSVLCAVNAHGVENTDRPNIVWISLEDITPMMGCYGDKYARTPVFDKLAAEGIRYTKAHSIAPVCSTSCSSIITGMYPSSLGTHHHRSNVGQPPAFVKMLPNLMSEAGYYTTNNAKQDYNIGGTRWHETSKKAHWRNRPDKDQPFFAVFNYGECHSSITKTSEDVIVQQRLNRLKPEDFHDPAKAPIPPYHPDVSEFRKAWSRYYDATAESGSFTRAIRASCVLDTQPPSANPKLQPALAALRQAASQLNVKKMRGIPYGLNEPFQRAINAITGKESYYRW